jgi:hypothetical protein
VREGQYSGLWRGWRPGGAWAKTVTVNEGPSSVGGRRPTPGAESEGGGLEDGESAPRLRRGSYLAIGPLLRAGMLGLLLVGLAIFGRPCADGVSDFIASFSPTPTLPEDRPGELRRLTDQESAERFPSLIAPDADGPARCDAGACAPEAEPRSR